VYIYVCIPRPIRCTLLYHAIGGVMLHETRRSNSRSLVFMDKQHDIQRLLSIRSLLTTPLASAILQTHPNDLFHNSDWDVVVPSEWRRWWDWAADDDDEEEKWIELVLYYNRPLDCLNKSIPEDLTRLIDSIRSLQLDRTCIYTHSSEPYAELPATSE